MSLRGSGRLTTAAVLVEAARADLAPVRRAFLNIVTVIQEFVMVVCRPEATVDGVMERGEVWSGVLS